MVPVRNGEIAVIGGSGFIGTALVRILLDSGYQVRILDIATPPACSAQVSYIYSDVTDPTLLEKTMEGCVAIVNLAAVHRDDVRPLSKYDEVNVDGARNVCLVAEKLGITDIVFTSSVAVYGLPVGVPNEETAPNPFNKYGETKLAAEEIYCAWQKRDSTHRRLETVRPTVVFGLGNRGNVYNLLSQLTRPWLVMIGRGENRKSMAFVQNVASFLAFLLQADHSPGSYLYNYCDTPTYDMNGLLRDARKALGHSPKPSIVLPYSVGIAIGTVFDIVARILDARFPISKVRVQKFCASTEFSSARMLATGFVPPVGIRDALLDTIRLEFNRPQAIGAK